MINFVGRTIQHYQILLKIRETPTRILYRAYDKRAHIYIALEVIKNSRFDPEQLLGQINEQTQKNAKLAHPNIATLTDSGIHNGTVYLVYDFYPTHTLRRFFNRIYSWEEMARELVPIAHALATAHDNNIIHGYLNPASIILDEKQNPILFDFGFEQIISDYILAHSPGIWINRWGLEYRAPEHINGAAPDKQSDIYSFGMILQEWLTGRNAMNSSTRSGRKKRQSSRQEKEGAQSLPAAIQIFIEKCTAPDPSSRYQSLQDVFVILANGALNMTISKQMVKYPLKDVSHRFSVRWSLIVLILAIILLALSGVFISMSGLVSGSHTPTSLPTISATQTSMPKQALPTSTLALPTFTSVPEIGSVETEFQGNVSFQGTPMPSLNNPIGPENAGQMSLIGQWGLGDLTGLTVSPNGKHVAVASSMGIFIFDAQSLEIEKHIETGSWISATAFSADGKMLASGEQDGLIEIWDTTNWQEAEIPFSGHTQTVMDLAFSPDGTKLASVGKDNKLIRWTLEDRANRLTVHLPSTGAGAVAYSADNSQIITGGNDFKIQIWDATDLTPIKSATVSAKIVDIARVGNTGLFVVGSSDQRINLLDIPNGLTLQWIGSLQYPLTTVAASPLGDFIAAGDLNGGLTVWDTTGNQIWKLQNYVTEDITALELPGSPNNISFSPDGKILFSGIHEGTIRSLDAGTGQEVKKDESFKGHVEKLAITDDSKYVITQNDTRTVTLWDLHNGKPIGDLQGEIEDGVPFSKDDSNLAIASDGSTVKVYKVPDLKEIYTLRGHQDIQTIKFIKEDAQLATGYNREMRLWSMASGQELRIQRIFPGTGCNTITDLHGLPIFLITDYQFIVPISQGNTSICAFQKLDWTTDIDRDGNFIAYGGNSKLAVIDLRNRLSAVVEMNVNRKNVVRVAISPGGKLLAAAYDDNVIHLWDVASKQEITSLDGHTDLITDLVFTLDGKMLFSTSMDGTIRVWGIPN